MKEVERFGKPVYESDENEANLPAHSNYDVSLFETLQMQSNWVIFVCI